MVRLILTDMDGTLLDSQSRLPEGFDAMMAELKRRGVMFGAASGRAALADQKPVSIAAPSGSVSAS